jgi:hypothetical protein
MKERLPFSLSPDQAMNIATEGYIYGFPAVLMDVTRDVMTAVPTPDGHKAPINQFAHYRTFPDATFTDVVSPNADTLYSIAWLDLSREPMILSVPETDRYYVLQMLDAWTNVFSSPGTRTTGNSKGDFAIVGPWWRGKVPDGLKAIHSPTRFVWIVGRTQTNGKEDYKNVNAIQDQYRLTPLESWGTPYTRPKYTPLDSAIDTTTPPVEQVSKMDAYTFFSRLTSLMRENPPAMADSAVLSRLATIGIAPGRPFHFNSLDSVIADGIRKGVEAARRKIATEARRSRGSNINGWDILPDNVANFRTDYDTRAYVATFGLGANLPEDAIYPRTMIDMHGQPLHGKNAFVIRFQKGQLPPVNAFWSITAYNAKQSFIPNPINRYAIGDRDNLRFEADGSLVIYISSVSPGAKKESNWLPVGPDAFNLIMRLYWPKNQVIKGMWRIPGVERVRPD